MSSYDENSRSQLRAALERAGAEPARARMAVDIACHAADDAMDALGAVVKRAPDTAIGLMAFELGTQLAASRMSASFERVHALGQGLGLPAAETKVSVPQ